MPSALNATLRTLPSCPRNGSPIGCPLFASHHPSRLSDTALTDTIKSMAIGTGEEAFVRQQRAIISCVENRPLLSTIRCPTMVLCGRQDQLTPLDRHQEMAAGINGATLEVVDDCGHMSSMEKPLQVNQALRLWLAA
ncbi:MAG: alpha/beta hydrolase [Vicinamibacterales bacterium]